MANTRSTRGYNPSDVPDGRRVRPRVSWQPTLLGSCNPAGSALLLDDAMVRRQQLDSDSWIDVAERWCPRADELFAELVRTAPWRSREVPMYGRIVAEPRLTAWWSVPADSPEIHPAIGAMSSALETHYGCNFGNVGAALYRDGCDSVAYHRDRVRDSIPDPVVAIVSLGEPRRFCVRPVGGGTGRAIEVRAGDLLVMGGACQHRFEHGVPKVSRAGPRISVQFRHRLAPSSA